MERIREGDPVDLGAGVEFSEVLFAELLDALPRSDDRQLVVHQANFQFATLPSLNLTGTRFQDAARFDGATFRGDTILDRASFNGRAGFDQVSFQGSTSFKAANFHDSVSFAWSTFEEKAEFKEATFQREAEFDGASFQDEAAFDLVKFEGKAEFDEATFHHLAGFGGASFRDEAGFGDASFQNVALFSSAVFHNDARFSGTSVKTNASFAKASFLHARELRGLLVNGKLSLNDAVFDQPVYIQAAAAEVSCRRARFLAGVHLRLWDAAIDLSDAQLAAPSMLVGVPFSTANNMSDPARVLVRSSPPHGMLRRPLLVSVERADVAGLHVADIDLRACRFADALNLDRLRIEGAPLLAQAPRRWHARRLTIAEEHHWRSERRRGRIQALKLDEPPSGGWYPPACRPPGIGPPRAIEPVRVAAVYRELRKGREDAKDEPGAADFYYGEMEMRRHSPATPGAERAILTLYWLVSGYGLRAWRALAALAAVIALIGAGLSQVGFHHPHPSVPVSLLYALQATVSLEGKAQQLSGQLTLPGELLRVGLRLSGPILLGLALLSIRNRVKR